MAVIVAGVRAVSQMRAFIIFRDRVTYAHLCLTAMTEAGLEPAVIDQGSTWPLALDWLKVLEAAGVLVLRRGGGHPRGLWDWPPFREACGDGRYVVTDPDTVPADDCPRDWPAVLGGLLDRHPEAAKAGLSLRTGNLPGHYSRRDQVIRWEQGFWEHPVDGGQAYRAGIDTTLAMYRPLSEQPMFSIDASLRAAPPYAADHLAWHEDLDALPEEIAWYYEHAEPGITHWAARGRSTFGD